MSRMIFLFASIFFVTAAYAADPHIACSQKTEAEKVQCLNELMYKLTNQPNVQLKSTYYADQPRCLNYINGGGINADQACGSTTVWKFIVK